MNPTTRIVIVGATSAMAEHCARLWIQQPGVELTLLGRDLARTERVAADLRVRNPQAHVHAAQTHFTDPTAIQARTAASLNWWLSCQGVGPGNCPL